MPWNWIQPAIEAIFTLMLLILHDIIMHFFVVKVANSLGKVELELKKAKPGHRWLYLGKERSGGSELSKITELSK